MRQTNRFIAALLFFALFAFSAPAFAQTASDRMHTAATKRGNSAYNAGDYDSAIRGFTEAIQASPLKPNAYRNLARSYFWKGDYASAVEFYDHYLRLATGDQDKLKAERRLAAERAGERVYTPPESQKLAVAALERELESGRAYTAGGGGAWGLYETVVRTKFAEPALAQLQSRLVRRLLDEFDAFLALSASQLTPRLDLDAWQLQAERVAAASSIAADEAFIEVLNRRSTVSEAAIAMLTSQWESASDLTKLARESNPDLGFIVWYEISSLIGAERYDDALAGLDALEQGLDKDEAARRGYASVLRAVTLQRLGRDQDAAALYLNVLRR